MKAYQPKQSDDYYVVKLAKHVKDVVGETLDGVAVAVNGTLFKKDQSNHRVSPSKENDQNRLTGEKLAVY
jgi:hypothetical protein